MGKLPALLLLLGRVVSADPANDGLTWLLAQQAADGSFGNSTNEQRELATAEALGTLRATGRASTPAARAAERYLAGSPRLPDTEVELRRELALGTSSRHGPTHAAGFEYPDVLHLALTLLADLAAGRAESAQTRTWLLELTARQQASGCWRWVDNDDSLERTAEAVGALHALAPVLPSDALLNLALERGNQCLRSGVERSTSLGATALALEALLLTPGPNMKVIVRARDLLLRAQAPDGNFGHSVRLTAIAVRGLTADRWTRNAAAPPADSTRRPGVATFEVGSSALGIRSRGATGTSPQLFRQPSFSAPSTPAFHYAVCALGSLVVLDRASVDSPVATHGDFTLGDGARIGGAVVAGGRATLRGHALVDGPVHHARAFTQWGDALASGGHRAMIPAPSPCECGFDLGGALAEAAASNDNARLVGYESFRQGALTVPHGGTLTLAAGRYFLRSLTLEQNALLTAPAGAKVRLYVEGGVTLEDGATLGAPVGSPGMLLVSGASAVALKNKVDAALELYVPNADLTLGTNAKLYGAVVGNAVTLSNNQRIELSGFTQSTPPPLTCP